MRSNLLPPLADRRPGATSPPAVAFALLSGNLAEATFYLPTQVLAHVFSRENNLEWAFRRDDLTTDDGTRHMALLAQAVRQLPDQWPPQQTDAEDQLFSMLGLTTPDETSSTQYWRDDARRDVLACRPPLHELSARSHGLALIRWLLHRILPYPCFLLDDLQLRARLRVDALDGGNGVSGQLLEQIDPYSYNGTLTGFGGPRWWSAGIEEWLFNTTEGQSGNPQAVAEAALATVREETEPGSDRLSSSQAISADRRRSLR
jgi:hypothetical protein